MTIIAVLRGGAGHRIFEDNAAAEGIVRVVGQHRLIDRLDLSQSIMLVVDILPPVFVDGEIPGGVVLHHRAADGGVLVGGVGQRVVCHGSGPVRVRLAVADDIEGRHVVLAVLEVLRSGKAIEAVHGEITVVGHEVRESGEHGLRNRVAV